MEKTLEKLTHKGKHIPRGEVKILDTQVNYTLVCSWCNQYMKGQTTGLVKCPTCGEKYSVIPKLDVSFVE